MSNDSDSCAVVAPRVRNCATDRSNNATGSATSYATMSLKALAALALERNKQSNYCATLVTKQRNSTCNSEGEKLHPFEVTAKKLQLAAGTDWHWVKDDTKLIEALTSACHIKQKMNADITPEWYTKMAHCENCGDVMLWEGCPETVLGCPWCLIKN